MNRKDCVTICETLKEMEDIAASWDFVDARNMMYRLFLLWAGEVVRKADARA